MNSVSQAPLPFSRWKARSCVSPGSARFVNSQSHSVCPPMCVRISSPSNQTAVFAAPFSIFRKMRLPSNHSGIVTFLWYAHGTEPHDQSWLSNAPPHCSIGTITRIPCESRLPGTTTRSTAPFVLPVLHNSRGASLVKPHVPLRLILKSRHPATDAGMGITAAAPSPAAPFAPMSTTGCRHPLTDPSTSPLTKYRCRKGYTNTMGIIDTMILALLSVFDEVCEIRLISSTVSRVKSCCPSTSV